jgi:Tol biopolymer transport system component
MLTPITNSNSEDVLLAVIRDSGKLQTYTMNPDGTGRTLVPSREQLTVIEPGWSPDGAKIADAYQGCGTPSGGCNPLVLETRNVDGTGGLDLTSGLQDNSQPDWQPIPINYYARPKGATPVLTSLTSPSSPARRPTAPTESHFPAVRGIHPRRPPITSRSARST